MEAVGGTECGSRAGRPPDGMRGAEQSRPLHPFELVLRHLQGRRHRLTCPRESDDILHPDGLLGKFGYGPLLMQAEGRPEDLERRPLLWFQRHVGTGPAVRAQVTRQYRRSLIGTTASRPDPVV